MMPLFQGRVRSDIVQELQDKDNIWEYLVQQTRKKLAPVTFLQNAGVLIRCVDNQREGHYSVQADVDRVNYMYSSRKYSL